MCPDLWVCSVSFGLLAVTVFVCLFISPQVRRRFAEPFYQGGLSDRSLKKEFFGDYLDLLGWLVISRGILIFFAPLFVGDLAGCSWGLSLFPDPLVIGFALIVLIWFQLPRMLKPDFLLIPMPISNKTYDEPKGDMTVHVAAGQEQLLMVRITNLGTHTYRDCVVCLYFPDGFEPLEEECRYKGLDFQKEFEIQHKHHGFRFTPKGNHLTMAPLDHLLFPMWVKAPQKSANNKESLKLRVELESETTWGAKMQELRISVK